jgi:hypothetical protein
MSQRQESLRKLDSQRRCLRERWLLRELVPTQELRRLINVGPEHTYDIELATCKKLGRGPGDELAVDDGNKGEGSVEASSIHLLIDCLKSVVVRVSQTLEMVTAICAAKIEIYIIRFEIEMM